MPQSAAMFHVRALKTRPSSLIQLVPRVSSDLLLKIPCRTSIVISLSTFGFAMAIFSSHSIFSYISAASSFRYRHFGLRPWHCWLPTQFCYRHFRFALDISGCWLILIALHPRHLRLRSLPYRYLRWPRHFWLRSLPWGTPPQPPHP